MKATPGRCHLVTKWLKMSSAADQWKKTGKNSGGCGYRRGRHGAAYLRWVLLFGVNAQKVLMVCQISLFWKLNSNTQSLSKVKLVHQTEDKQPFSQINFFDESINNNISEKLWLEMWAYQNGSYTNTITKACRFGEKLYDEKLTKELH